MLTEFKQLFSRCLHSGGQEETPREKQISDNLYLHEQSQLLLDAIGMHGPLELEFINKNIDNIKNEMINRGLTELKLDSKYTIKLNADRSINILTKE